MLVMDSGLGGISVVRALRVRAAALPLYYLADTAGFPYGARSPSVLLARAEALITAVAARATVGSVVLACNTLSTLCLESLRAQMPQPFIGTVPAIKVAAQHSLSRRFTLLATPNTTHSAYTDGLIARFAADCVVDAVGAAQLAPLAERLMLGDAVSDAALAAEIAPAFCADARGRTDVIVLGCTHYPLILERLRAVAPWEVRWVDSSDAIARRALEISPATAATPAPSVAYVTHARDLARYEPLFRREGFDRVKVVELGYI